MKKVLFFVLLLLFAFCKKEEPSLIGEWKLVNVETNQKIQNPSAYSLTLRALMNTTKIKFYPNQEFSGTIWGDTSFGSWQKIGDSLKIYDKYTKKPFTVYIQKFTAKKLILEEKDDSIITTLTFEKK